MDNSLSQSANHLFGPRRSGASFDTRVSSGQTWNNFVTHGFLCTLRRDVAPRKETSTGFVCVDPASQVLKIPTPTAGSDSSPCLSGSCLHGHLSRKVFCRSTACLPELEASSFSSTQRGVLQHLGLGDDARKNHHEWGPDHQQHATTMRPPQCARNRHPEGCSTPREYLHRADTPPDQSHLVSHRLRLLEPALRDCPSLGGPGASLRIQKIPSPNRPVTLEQASSFLKKARELVAAGSRSAATEPVIKIDITGAIGVADSYPKGPHSLQPWPHAVIIVGSENRGSPIDAERWPGNKSLMPSVRTIHINQSHVWAKFQLTGERHLLYTDPRSSVNRATFRPGTSGAAKDPPLNNRHDPQRCHSPTDMQNLKEPGTHVEGTRRKGQSRLFRREANSLTCLITDSSLQRSCPTSRSKSVSRLGKKCLGHRSGPTTDQCTAETGNSEGESYISRVVHVSCLRLEQQTDGTIRTSQQISVSHTQLAKLSLGRSGSCTTTPNINTRARKESTRSWKRNQTPHVDLSTHSKEMSICHLSQESDNGVRWNLSSNQHRKFWYQTQTQKPSDSLFSQLHHVTSRTTFPELSSIDDPPQKPPHHPARASAFAPAVIRFRRHPNPFPIESQMLLSEIVPTTLPRFRHSHDQVPREKKNQNQNRPERAYELHRVRAPSLTSSSQIFVAWQQLQVSRLKLQSSILTSKITSRAKWHVRAALHSSCCRPPCKSTSTEQSSPHCPHRHFPMHLRMTTAYHKRNQKRTRNGSVGNITPHTLNMFSLIWPPEPPTRATKRPQIACRAFQRKKCNGTEWRQQTHSSANFFKLSVNIEHSDNPACRQFPLGIFGGRCAIRGLVWKYLYTCWRCHPRTHNFLLYLTRPDQVRLVLSFLYQAPPAPFWAQASDVRRPVILPSPQMGGPAPPFPQLALPLIQSTTVLLSLLIIPAANHLLLHFAPPVSRFCRHPNPLFVTGASFFFFTPFFLDEVTGEVSTVSLQKRKLQVASWEQLSRISNPGGLDHALSRDWRNWEKKTMRGCTQIRFAHTFCTPRSPTRGRGNIHQWQVDK